MGGGPAKDPGNNKMNEEKIREAVLQAFEQQGQQEKALKVERYHRLNRYVRPGQILFAGSSLMEQFPVEEFAGELELPLRIYNRGIGGFTTLELLEEKAVNACIYELSPAYMFLNIGTNDLNDPELSIGGLMDRYSRILDGICEHLPQTKITLLAYYPVNEPVGLANPLMADVFRSRSNAKLLEANKAVEELAHRYGADYKNLNAGITDETGNLKAEYTIEGMHIYPDGYRQVWDALKDHLKEICQGA